MMIERVFVYGTLKRGERNHSVMGHAKFVRTARAEHCAIYDLGSYPAVVFVQEASAVEGELFEVPTSMLARLDAFEGVPFLYTRERVELRDGPAWIYVMKSDGVAGRCRLRGRWSRKARCA